MRSTELRVATLGGVVATYGGRPLELGGPTQRLLLAALVIEPNRWVSIQVLGRWVWSSQSGDITDLKPRIWAAISRLNKVLRDAGAGTRVSVDKPNGTYRFAVAEGELDLLQFELWARKATTALAAGQMERAKGFAHLALGLWAGDPFGDLVQTPFLGTKAADLEGRRRIVQGVLARAELATGHPDEAVLGAGGLVRLEPGNQHWAELLALGYYAGGRTQEALEVIRRCRDELVERAGLDVHDALGQLEQAMLTNDPGLDHLRRAAPRAALDERPIGPKTVLVSRLDLPPARTLEERSPVESGYFEAEVVAAVHDHHGDVVDQDSRSLAAVFEDPIDAVLAALDAAKALAATDAEEPIRAAIAVHTGHIELRGDSMAGPEVDHAEALCGACHPGQVVVSEATGGLVVDHLPLGARLRTIAAWQAGGSDRAERVHQLMADGLGTDFPPLGRPAQVVGLPAHHTTNFLGREHETADIGAKLRPGTLVTIVGPGGIGKTRLAAEVADRPLNGEDVEAFFCDVTLAEGPASLDESVARCLGLRVGRSRTEPALRNTIVEALVGSPVLVVLDGCERPRPAVADLVNAILTVRPAARLLATSQVPLGVVGEQVVRLGPLATDPHRPGVAPYAVQLLVARAQAAGATVDADDPALAELARRLDGLPLAIELVATQLPSTTAGAIVEHLDEYLEDASGPSSLPPRQRTLGGTFAWSVELAHPVARRLAAALSVFDGPFSLDAAEAVAPSVDVDPHDVRRLIAELVRLSILHRYGAARGPALYRMPGTLGTFAAEELKAFGRVAQAAELHADHVLANVEDAFAHRRGPDEAAWARAVLAQLDDVRVAYRHFMDVGDLDKAARLVVALGDDLLMRERHEVGRWARELCARGVPSGSPTSAEVLGLAADSLMNEGRLDEALRHAQDAIEIDAATGALPRAWLAHNVMAMAGLAHLEEPSPDGAFGAHLRRVEEIGEALGDPFPRALALWDRLFLAEMSGQHQRADGPAQRLRVLADRCRNASIVAMSLVAEGRVAMWRKDTATARELLYEALGAAEAAQNTYMQNCALQELAALDDASDPRAALAALLPLARTYIAVRNVARQAQTAQLMARCLVQAGHPAPAARALVTLRHSPMAKITGFDQLLDDAMGRLAPLERDAARRRGAAVSLSDVLGELVVAVERVV